MSNIDYRKEGLVMSKDEIVLQLTLKILDNFKYKAEEYGGDPLIEQGTKNAELAATIFNGIHEKLKTDLERSFSEL